MEDGKIARLARALRIKTKHIITNKYYSLYLNNYKWTELNYQQNDYFFRKMWELGKLACFKIKNMDGYDSLCFTPFNPIDWNNYNFPVHINLINERGVPFIPSKLMNVDEDVVIGWAQRNLKSVREMVDFYINKIVDYEMLLYVQMNAHKVPFLIGVTEENKERIEKFMKNLVMDDALVLFCGMSELQLFKALVSGAPYIMDKIYQMKQAYENELLTFLGIDNLGGSEKKEHLITSEVESNNMLIKDNADTFVDILREFAERIQKVFGMKITLECKSESFLMMEEQMKQDSDTMNKEEGGQEE